MTRRLTANPSAVAFLWSNSNAVESLTYPSRVERLAPLITGICFAIPVLVVAFPPMADVPLHEASVALLRHWGDPVFAPPTIYFLNLGHANQLFSFLVLAVSFVAPIAWATKIVVAGALVGLPVAAARFARHLGAPLWSALLVAPLGLGWMFFWGLIQNIIGLVALLALLPTIDAFAKTPTWAGVGRLCGAVVLLHFAHQAMLVVAGLALVLCCVGTDLRLQRMAMRAIPLACGALVTAVANHLSWHHAGPMNKSTYPFTFDPLEHKVEAIPGVIYGGFEVYVRNLMFVLGFVACALFALDRWRASERAKRTWMERLHHWRFEIFAGALFAVYLLAPASIKSTTLVYHRFLPAAWAVFAVCVGAHTRGQIGRIAPLVCVALPIASLLIAWPTFADSDEVFSDLAELTKQIEPGNAVFSLNAGPDLRHRLWSPQIAMGQIVAEKGGRSLFDYTNSPVSPVSQRPEKQLAQPLDRMQHDPFAFRPHWDFTRFRYVVVYSIRPGLREAIHMAIGGDAERIGHAGDWDLYESRLTVLPIDANDKRLPMPPPPSLGDLLDEIAKQQPLSNAEHSPRGAGDDPGEHPAL